MLAAEIAGADRQQAELSTLRAEFEALLVESIRIRWERRLIRGQTAVRGKRVTVVVPNRAAPIRLVTVVGAGW